MNHTPNPIYESKSGRTTLSLVFTILITGGLFLIILLTQISSQWLEPKESPKHKKVILSAPPKFVPPPPSERIEKEIEDDITMDPVHEDLSLRDISMSFGKGIGEGVRTLMKDFRQPAFDPEQLIYLIEVLDIPPKALIQPAPAYPPELKRAGVEGNVSVIFIVSENGKVGSISIKNATHREFAS